MSASTRRIVALLIACALASGVVYLINHIAAGATPHPAGDLAALKAALEAGDIPFNALLLVMGGWFLAAYIGSTVASRLSGEGRPAQLFALIFTLAILATQLERAHPVWMWMGGLLGVPLIALGAARQSITIRSS
jgi:hypothetical protein